MTARDDAGSRDRLASIAAFGRAMNAARSIVDVAEFVAEEIRVAALAATVSISRWEPENGHLRTLVNVGELAPWEERRPANELYEADSYTILLDVVAAGRAAVFRVDDPGCPASEVENLVGLGKHSSLVSAIRYGERVWGELYLTRTAQQPPFSQEDLDLADGIAGFVAMAFVQGDHIDVVTRIAYRDALTDLANRRAADDALRVAFDRRLASGTPVGLVVCDVNGLKAVNDTSGHEAGDRLIIAVAEAVRRAASAVPGALAARLGGDEFCIVLDGVPGDVAVRVADDLCAGALAATGGSGVSCGVASTDEPALAQVDTSARLFRIADAVQYRAKRARLTVPVVAGRTDPRPPAPSVGVSPSSRGRDHASTAQPQTLVQDVLDEVDRVTAGGAQARLRAVGEVLARRVNAAAWYLARVDPGSTVLRTVAGGASRPSNTLPTWDQDGLVGCEWSLDEYPASRAVLAGGGFDIRARDDEADPAERAVLLDSGYEVVAVAGAADAGGRGWLLEVYADDLSDDVTGLGTVMRVLVAAAVQGATEPVTGRRAVRRDSGDRAGRSGPAVLARAGVTP